MAAPFVDPHLSTSNNELSGKRFLCIIAGLNINTCRIYDQGG